MPAPPKKPEVTKQFVLDHLDENEVDLSMCGLTKVPVKELALVPRGTRLDLSRNHFSTLPDMFCTLRHLVELDLSNNQLSQLPPDFGQLSQLQRLDLYSNQLTTLPLSFGQLTKLKWLDLKNNPLDADLGKAAGQCLSERECKEGAKKVLVYMKEKESEAERRRLKKAAEQRARELRREAERQAKREAAKKERAEVRQRRRMEHEQREEAERRSQEEEGEERDVVMETKLPPSTRHQTSCFQGCLWLSATLLLVLILALFVVYQTSWLEPILVPPTGREGKS